MEVIPVINCEDRVSAEKKIAAVGSFLEPGNFVHLDVADGIFAVHKTWNAPMALRGIIGTRFAVEAHLMVEHPAVWITPWLAAGVTRFIVHLEAINETTFRQIKKLCDHAGATLMLTSNPETPVRNFLPYLDRCASFQVLAVHPGLAGQPFLPETLQKVTWLRRKVPHAIIEVDGGITLATAKLAKDAGASVIVSASDIFNREDPRAEYEALKRI